MDIRHVSRVTMNSECISRCPIKVQLALWLAAVNSAKSVPVHLYLTTLSRLGQHIGSSSPWVRTFKPKMFWPKTWISVAPPTISFCLRAQPSGSLYRAARVWYEPFPPPCPSMVNRTIASSAPSPLRST